MSHLDRPGDAPHHHVKVLLDETKVGDVEGEVLHEAGGDGVGVRCWQKYILLSVDTRKCQIQIFQDFHLTKGNNQVLLPVVLDFFHLDKLADHCGVTGDKDDPAAGGRLLDDESPGERSDVDACMWKSWIRTPSLQKPQELSGEYNFSKKKKSEFLSDGWHGGNYGYTGSMTPGGSSLIDLR